MTAAQFDFAPLLPAGLPAPAARWTGLAKYSFVGGNNDPDQVPVDGLVDADQCRAQARGQDARDLRPRQRPAGLSPAARIPHRQSSSAMPASTCAADDILIVSGSLQALDLVNATLLARGDTVSSSRTPIRARSTG